MIDCLQLSVQHNDVISLPPSSANAADTLALWAYLSGCADAHAYMPVNRLHIRELTYVCVAIHAYAEYVLLYVNTYVYI